MADRSALRRQTKIVRRSLTDAIKSTEPKDGFIYGAATNWIYQGSLDAPASKLKKSRGLKKSQNLRDNLTDTELVSVMFSEQMAAELISSTGEVSKSDLIRVGQITKEARRRCLKN